MRRARLLVPAAELLEIATAGIFHGFYKLFNGHCLAIVTGKVEVTAGAKSLCAQQSANHANHFRALLVDGQCVEVINFHVGVWLHRMRHWAAVFSELVSAQVAGTLDTLYRRRVHIGRKLRIAVDRETLF